MRVLLIGLFAYVATSSAGAQEAARAACTRPAATAARLIGARELAGGWEWTLVVERGRTTRSVTGVLWLWPASTSDSSPTRGARAMARDTALVRLYGATDIRIEEMRREGPADEAGLRDRTDPVFPDLLVTQSASAGPQSFLAEPALWYRSESNDRARGPGLDGSGYLFRVTEADASGFRGRFGPAGLGVTDTGHFCARRLATRAAGVEGSAGEAPRAAAAALDSLFAWADTILLDPGTLTGGGPTSYPTRVPTRVFAPSEWEPYARAAELRTDTLPSGEVVQFKDIDRPMELLWKARPRSAFFVSVSPVKFDASGTTAEGTIAVRCGPRCGSGDRVFLRRVDHGWRVERIQPLWRN
jgi:hypothetical protein